MPFFANIFTSPVLAEIELLDSLADHQRIVFLSCRIDFAWDITRALEFALFRTFAVPSISALLHKTGEFELRPQKRYDDTDIIVSTLMEVGYDSERGKAALERMNQALLKLRGRLLRFWPRRTRPLLRTAMIAPTYPGGYRIEDLGPPQAEHWSGK